ncbi:HD-GYP domain-containing protein [Fusibacter sp. JL298sf-3]
MRLKSIERLEIGEKLAKPIYDNKCNLLLAKDCVLTQNYLKRLKEANIQCAYIDDALTQDLIMEEVIPDELKIRSVSTVKNAFESLAKNQGNVYTLGNCEAIKQTVDTMLQLIYENHSTLYCMTELMGTDMYTYYHSAEVAILSMMVARSMGLNNTFVEKIGIGAMLHDVGKMKVDATLLNKREPLTEAEWLLMKEHPKVGYEMLKDATNISPISRQIVLLHHEKLDGSGYPHGFENAEIPIAVRVVTMCDIFNAVTTNRSYKQRMNADMALELLRAETVYELDREVLHHLLKVVNIYPVGTFVELSDGREAVVIEENKLIQTRPKVQVVENRQRQDVIDLMEHLTLFVARTLDD